MENNPEGQLKDDKFIDLDKVLNDKNPKLAKLVPGFALRYLKKVVHQDDLNAIISRNKHLYGLDFINAVLQQFGCKIECSNTDLVPVDGRWVVASNHPLGGLDGLALMSVVGNRKRDIVFPVNDILMHVENLKSLFIPINKHGSNAGNVKLFDETFASGKGIIYFPAGLCSRKQHGQIEDLEWKKAFINKARQHHRDIIPCHVEARNTNRFYNIARLRNKLGIKSNLEMVLLVDEMFRQHDKKIIITFGKPISYETFDRSKTDLVWAQMLKEYVYRLGTGYTKPFLSD